MPVVLDEFGYLIESDPSLDSVVAAALGPAARSGKGRTRLILCGSAMGLMRTLTRGEAPLRGRAGIELVMQPMEFRHAAERLAAGVQLDLAASVYSVIGGVIGYYTDMVDRDLPGDASDFDRWVIQRVLSPAATLHHEATTLLAEDPSLASGTPAVFHSILGAIANGSVTAGHVSKRLGRSVASLDPSLKRLIAAGFVLRTDDPMRSQRPTYALADPFLQFHYAILEPYGSLLRTRDIGSAWRERLAHVFDSRVRGPVFEELARSWTLRHAAPETLGGNPDIVGASAITVDGISRQLDVVVATVEDPSAVPAERTVIALGEAKSGETAGMAHLRSLEAARSAMGARAAHAKLLLFAPSFQKSLASAAASRPDVELVDLERLYRGS